MSVGRRRAGDRDRRGAKADLHTHTIYSDGAHTPEELVHKARAAGLDMLSITDHDSINGVVEAIAHGRAAGVEIIPGIELSAILNGREIHIVGYFLDIEDAELVETLKRLRAERLRRAEQIVAKLNALGVPLAIEAVMKFAGEGAVGRPHIARAMVEQGFVDSYYQAFNRYISDYGPAYVRRAEISPGEIIGLIARAHGLSILAHPGKSITEPEILSLIRSGIDGIEVTHPSHSAELMQYYRGIVNQYYLVESGGSDYHGGIKGDEHTLGHYYITGDRIAAMERRLPIH